MSRSCELVPPPKSMLMEEGVYRGDLDEIRVDADHAELPAEAYRLIISKEAVDVYASDLAGAFYAKQTLKQWAALHSGKLPCVEIEDAPEFPERGYMLDISRCRVPTMQTLFELVDLLAHFKYNQLQLYTEHTFAYAGHETVWRNSSPMTAEQLRELDTYCQERFIELVPNQNSLGHFERWLKHPEYHPYAECPDGFTHPVSGVRKTVGSTLAPSVESKNLILDLYAQLLPNFQSNKFNIGCDEPWELGEGRSGQVRPEAADGDVFFDWLDGLCSHLSEQGVQPYYWADVALKYPDKLKRLSGNGRAVLWGYEPDHPFDEQCEHLKASQVEFLVSPGDSTWNSLTGRWDIARQNIPAAAKAAKRWGSRGLLLTHWGDQGHAQPWPTLLPAIVLGGAYAWNADPGAVDVEHGLDRYAFKGQCDGLGAWLCQVGSIDTRLDTLRFNRSLILTLLRESPFPGDFELALSEVPLDRLSTEIDSLANGLSKVDFRGFDNNSLYQECALILEYLRAAKQQLLGEDGKIEPELLKNAESVWLKRFRSGGLAESMEGYLFRRD